MGMAQHEATPRGLHEPQAGFQPRPSVHLDRHVFFHMEYADGDSRLKVWVFYYRPCQRLLVCGLVLG